MRLIHISSIATALLSGCIIVGEMPKGTWGDTGAFEVEIEEDETETRISVTPDQLQMGTRAEFLVTAEPLIEYELVSDVFALNGAEVHRFTPTKEGLVVLIGAPEGLEPGPVSLILEYADGSMDVAREALEIVDPNAELSEGDTGEPENEVPE